MNCGFPKQRGPHLAASYRYATRNQYLPFAALPKRHKRERHREFRRPKHCNHPARSLFQFPNWGVDRNHCLAMMLSTKLAACRA